VSTAQSPETARADVIDREPSEVLIVKELSTTSVVPDAVCADAPARDRSIGQGIASCRTRQFAASLDGPAGVRRTRKALTTAFQAQIDGKGYSLIEILSPCPIHLHLSPVEAMRHVKEQLTPIFPVKVSVSFRISSIERTRRLAARFSCLNPQ